MSTHAEAYAGWPFEFFKRSEFACKCGCGKNDISFSLVRKLDEIRAIVGFPLKVNSGCRCSTYNKTVGGKEDSAHTRGLAVDIQCTTSRKRYILMKLFLMKFNRVGVYKTFLHVDLDEEKPKYVLWAEIR